VAILSKRICLASLQIAARRFRITVCPLETA
jgi:hypothetical protein